MFKTIPYTLFKCPDGLPISGEGDEKKYYYTESVHLFSFVKLMSNNVPQMQLLDNLEFINMS